MSAGPFSTILDTKMPWFEMLPMSSCGEKITVVFQGNNDNAAQNIQANKDETEFGSDSSKSVVFPSFRGGYLRSGNVKPK